MDLAEMSDQITSWKAWHRELAHTLGLQLIERTITDATVKTLVAEVERLDALLRTACLTISDRALNQKGNHELRDWWYEQQRRAGLEAE